MSGREYRIDVSEELARKITDLAVKRGLQVKNLMRRILEAYVENEEVEDGPVPPPVNESLQKNLDEKTKDADPLSVGCGLCFAAPDNHCRSESGVSLTTCHNVRKLDAWKSTQQTKEEVDPKLFPNYQKQMLQVLTEMAMHQRQTTLLLLQVVENTRKRDNLGRPVPWREGY